MLKSVNVLLALLMLVLRLCSLLSCWPSLMAMVLGDASGDACNEESEDDKNEDDAADGGACSEESNGRSRNSSTSVGWASSECRQDGHSQG